jgi:cytochrome c oxidase subunit 2
MAFRNLAPRQLRRWAPALCLSLAFLWLAGCAQIDYPQSTLHPKGDFAHLVDGLFRTTLRWATVVFFLVEGALVYALFRFRGKPSDAEPEQTHGNAILEVVWTVIPAVILVLIAIPTIKTIFKTAAVPDDDPLVVEVIGHQWWWEFKYPEYNLVTANELHVPVGRTVDLKMTTVDVLHSFWTPQLAGKRDVFPGRENRLWFKAEQAGDYPGQCAEFCGLQHGRMAFRVVAEDPAAFEAWRTGLAALAATPAAPDTAQADTSKAAPPAEDPLVAQGRQLFNTKGCLGCHALSAVGAPSMTGPNLAGIGDRTHIAAGWLPNTDENLASWLRDPQAVKVGVLMPKLGLNEDEIKALVAYLRSHRAVAATPSVAAAH